MGDILIVDDEEDIRDMVSGILQDEGFATRQAADSDEALAAIAHRLPELLILDIWLKGSKMDGTGILRTVKRDHPDLPVVVISGHANIDLAVASIKQGAYDFIEKPFKIDHTIAVIRRGLEAGRLRRENQELRMREAEGSEMIGQSSAFRNMMNQIDKVTRSNGRVMLTGPAGSGKELAARYIHANSARSEGPFVTVACASIGSDGMEEALFGAESAERGVVPGLLEQARGGVVYFDEVSELPPAAQARLVRVLVEHSLQRIGGAGKIETDFRVISATSRDLEEDVGAGGFRAELYDRLNVVPVRVPGLSERQNDIPALAVHFIKRFNALHGLPLRTLSGEAAALLQATDWPGNVRQLRNVIERVLILGDPDGEISADELPGESGPDDSPQGMTFGSVASMPLRLARKRFEVEYLMLQMNRFGGNVSRTAKFVGMERSALHRKLKYLKIAPERADETG